MAVKIEFERAVPEQSNKNKIYNNKSIKKRPKKNFLIEVKGISVAVVVVSVERGPSTMTMSKMLSSLGPG